VTAPRAIEVRLDDDVVRADAVVLAGTLRESLRACGACVVVAHVGALTPDVGAVGALARLQLAVRRMEAVLVLDEVGGDLRGLLRLCGLASELPVRGEGPVSSVVEVVGQAELGEQGRTDEVGDAGDPAVADLEHVDRPRLTPAGDGTGLVLREGG
jgi:hypothetical protein